MSIDNIVPKPVQVTVHLVVIEFHYETTYKTFWTRRGAITEMKKRIRETIELERMDRATNAYGHGKLSEIETMLADETTFLDALEKWREFYDGNVSILLVDQDLIME